MAGHLGLREVLPDQSALLHWRNITIDTGRWHSVFSSHISSGEGAGVELTKLEATFGRLGLGGY